MKRRLSSIRFKDVGDRFSSTRFSDLRKSIHGAKTIKIKQSKSCYWFLLFTTIIQLIMIIGICFIFDWPKQLDNVKTFFESDLKGENVHVNGRLGYAKSDSLEGDNMQVKGNSVPFS